jgi:predicted alpha/beta-hydrolase family hydrolase
LVQAGAPDTNGVTKSILVSMEPGIQLGSLKKLNSSGLFVNWELGYNATAVDLPGHRELKHVPIAEVTMNAYVERYIEDTNAIDGGFILAGHSLGGSIVSQVAAGIPEKIELLAWLRHCDSSKE